MMKTDETSNILNKLKWSYLDDNLESMKPHLLEVSHKSVRDEIIGNSIIYGSVKIITYLKDLGWFEDKWFGCKKMSWFQFLFEHGFNNVGQCFNLLVSMNKLTTENILCEIIHNQRIFKQGFSVVVQFLADNIEKLDNEMLLMPCSLLLLNGHLHLAAIIREHYEMTGNETINDNLLYEITSKDGLALFLEMINSTSNLILSCDVVYRILYKIRPYDRSIINYLLEYSHHPAFVHYIINNLIENNVAGIIPPSLTLYDDYIFKSIRSYYKKSFYSNMPMERNVSLDRLVVRFPNHYRKIKHDDILVYYLLINEEPFIVEDFNIVLNDFLDNHRVHDGNLECQICLEMVEGENPIQCCLSENFSDGHTFCENCIRKWLKPECRTCPICRSEIL